MPDHVAATRTSAAGLAPTGMLADLSHLSLTSLGYYFGAELGAHLRFPDSLHSILWPPNAILLAAFMLLPRRLWPWCVVAVIPSHFAILLKGGIPFLPAAGLFVTNNLQAMLGAALAHYLGKNKGRGARTIAFVIFGVFLAPFIVSFIDVGVTVWSGLAEGYWQTWCLRFLSNAASVVIFVPPIVGAARLVRERRLPSPKCLLEATTLFALAIGIAACVVLLGAEFSRTLALLICAFLPLLLWSAVRFGEAGAGAVLLVLAFGTMGVIDKSPPGFFGQIEIMVQQAIFLLVATPVLYLGALYEDIRRYVRQLDVAAGRYDRATQAASIGVWDWNTATDELFVHPHLKKLLGYEDAEIENTRAAWMGAYHPDDVEKVLHLARRSMRGEADSFEVEHRMIHRDGSVRWLLTRGAPVRGGASVVGTCVDVTERKHIEDELHLARQELAHLTRAGMLGALSGALAHEITQPLAAILSNGQAAQLMLDDDPIDREETQAALEDIVQAARRAGDMIHGLRDMLRKTAAEFHPVDINAVAGEVLNLAHSDLITHQVTVVRQFDPATVDVNGDRVQLQQVLLNLIMNACDAMQSSTNSRRVLTISTTARADRKVEVVVSDTGDGLSPQVSERLFQPFTTTKKNGLGLGLSISRTIIAAHGGDLQAENRVEGGAAFYILLPAAA